MSILTRIFTREDDPEQNEAEATGPSTQLEKPNASEEPVQNKRIPPTPPVPKQDARPMDSTPPLPKKPKQPPRPPSPPKQKKDANTGQEIKAEPVDNSNLPTQSKTGNQLPNIPIREPKNDSQRHANAFPKKSEKEKTDEKTPKIDAEPTTPPTSEVHKIPDEIIQFDLIRLDEYMMHLELFDAPGSIINNQSKSFERVLYFCHNFEDKNTFDTFKKIISKFEEHTAKNLPFQGEARDSILGLYNILRPKFQGGPSLNLEAVERSKAVFRCLIEKLDPHQKFALRNTKSIMPQEYLVNFCTNNEDKLNLDELGLSAKDFDTLLSTFSRYSEDFPGIIMAPDYAHEVEYLEKLLESYSELSKKHQSALLNWNESGKPEKRRLRKTKSLVWIELSLCLCRLGAAKLVGDLERFTDKKRILALQAFARDKRNIVEISSTEEVPTIDQSA